MGRRRGGRRGPGRGLSHLQGEAGPAPAGRFRRSTGPFSSSSTSRSASSGATTRGSRTSCPRASSGQSSRRISQRPCIAFPSLVIKDINGDGDNEVLFAPKRKRGPDGIGLGFICFDRRGREIWRFEAGRELKCGDKVFSPDYRIAGFVCHDLDGDGRLETLVVRLPEARLALPDGRPRRFGPHDRGVLELGLLEISRLP